MSYALIKLYLYWFFIFNFPSAVFKATCSCLPKELSKINGVKKVEIDLASGKVEIDTETEIGKSDLENAIKEAGYELK